MRRIIILSLVFSLFITGCKSSLSNSTEPIAERMNTEFDEWNIPGTFILKDIYIVGLGDSLTVGLGDEFKRGGYFRRLTNAMTQWQGVKDVEVTNLAVSGRRSDRLLQQLEEPKTRNAIKSADIVVFTIGGNDIMKVVKRDLFNLKKQAFYDELEQFTSRLNEIFTIIRTLNSDAIIIVGGLYNPFTIVTDEETGFEEILSDWNNAIEVQTELDEKSCFVPVTDLFNSNSNMVYHTDFFHPNARGYEEMANRFLEKIDECGLFQLSDGELDM
jgi:lysophospholipase L1-like esterase